MYLADLGHQLMYVATSETMMSEKSTDIVYTRSVLLLHCPAMVVYLRVDESVIPFDHTHSAPVPLARLLKWFG